MDIGINTVWRYKVENGKEFRVIGFDKKFKYTVVIDLVDEDIMPYWILLNELENLIEIREIVRISDPTKRFYGDEFLSKKDKAFRDKIYPHIIDAWENNASNLLDKEKRWEAFHEVAIKLNVSNRTAARYFSRFWKYGMAKDALLPKYYKCGARGESKKKKDETVKSGRPKIINASRPVSPGISITEEHKKNILDSYMKHYWSNKSIRYKTAYKTMLKDSYSDIIEGDDLTEILEIHNRHKVPSYRQYLYWIRKSQNAQEDYIEKFGKNSFQRNIRPLYSDVMQDVSGPGSLMQVDATVGDIEVINPYTKTPMGKPYIYTLIDIYSRLITAIYIGMGSPSWTMAMMAIDNLVTNKEEYCKSLGLNSVKKDMWPCEHLPQVILADNAEWASSRPLGLKENFGITVENAASYRGDLKSVVERLFGKINGFIKEKLPGAVLKDSNERGQPSPTMKAELTIDALIQIVVSLVVTYNNTPIDGEWVPDELITSTTPITPAFLWTWGMENVQGLLQNNIDREWLRTCMLPRQSAFVTKTGLKLRNQLAYYNENYEKDFLYNKNQSKKVTIGYDPRLIDSIVAFDDYGNSYKILRLTPKFSGYKGWSFFEYDARHKAVLDMRARNEPIKNETDVNLYHNVEMIRLKNNILLSDYKKPKSKYQALKGKKGSAVMYRLIEMKFEAFKFGEKNTNKNKVGGVELLDSIPILRVDDPNDKKNNWLQDLMAGLDMEDSNED